MLEVVPSQQESARVLLSPAQRNAAEGVLRALERTDVVVLQDRENTGKTTVLAHVREQLGGTLVGVREFLAALAGRPPLAIEEAFLTLLDGAIAEARLVLVDDLQLIQNVADNCDYIRKYLLDAAIAAALETAKAHGTKLVFATDDIPPVLRRRAHTYKLPDFTPEDYAAICAAYLDPAVIRRLDFTEIHRYAPSLSAHHLRKAAQWLAAEPGVDTERFCDYLASLNLSSNVDIAEVEPVTWNKLKGVDDVIEELETKIALPFENRELAQELNLRPKRGVLLAGPPGTGKTTIGRALAHRLKGKFFLVDGTMIAGSHHFYSEIDRVFEDAERNAPSVVFIDDADVIFGGEKERGLYRYLLTKLDGLESAGTGRICVMMTAMEPSDLPAAILRSGRVELWLETRLPDAEARAAVFRDRLAPLPAPLRDADVERLAEAGRGCTGADLKAVIDDGKLRFARDKACGKTPRPVDEYFLDAIESVRKHRRRYQQRRPLRIGEPVAFGFNAE